MWMFALALSAKWTRKVSTVGNHFSAFAVGDISISLVIDYLSRAGTSRRWSQVVPRTARNGLREAILTLICATKMRFPRIWIIIVMSYNVTPFFCASEKCSYEFLLRASRQYHYLNWSAILIGNNWQFYASLFYRTIDKLWLAPQNRLVMREVTYGN